MVKAKGIYKRGKIYWIRYAGPDGKTIYESTKSASYMDAQKHYMKRKKEVQDGELPDAVKRPDMTLNELADKYLEWAQRQRGIRGKRGFVRQLLATFGNLQLKHFNTMLLEQFQTDRIEKRGNMPATVNRLMSTIRHMFTKAVDWELVSADVLKKVRKAKPLKGENSRLRFLSQEECNALLDACDEYLKPIVVTALNTGMRKSEILKLRWNQVDLKHGFILLDNETKNGERREIPVNASLRVSLGGLMRRLDLPFVFHNPDTEKPYIDIKKSWAKALQKSRIPDFRFHDLRHTFASHLAMSGVELITIKELLGHKDIKMTLRYAHLSPAQKKRAVDILDQALTGAAAPTIQKLYNPRMVETASVL